VNEPQQRFSGAPVPTPPIPDDDGSISAELAARLDDFATGSVGADRVLEALSRSRLFVPVVAVLDEAEVGDDGLSREKQSSMATVLVQSTDGGRALLGFSSIDALTRWRTEARPVPLAAPLAARAAVDEGAETLLIDVAGPLADAELLLVAAVSRSPGDPCEDPVLMAALGRLVRAEGRVVWATLSSAGEVARSGAEPRAPAVLRVGVEGTDRSWLGPFVQQIASDRVVGRLLPEGLRVKEIPASDMSDTPGVLLG
jgi:hypothetical protein